MIVIAEGLAELLPYERIEGVTRDDHGHIAVSKFSLGRLFARLVAAEYTRQTGKTRKITGLQLGYECRCARPQAFDVLLGSQLGVGGLPGVDREAARRRDGLGRRPVGTEVRAVRRVDRPGHAGDRRPPNPRRQRLSPPGAILGDVLRQWRAVAPPPVYPSVDYAGVRFRSFSCRSLVIACNCSKVNAQVLLLD